MSSDPASSPDPDRLRDIFNRAVAHIERRWNIPVRIQDVPDPFTGDLDGEQIMVDHDLEPENAVFILIHLFGHTVQWNLSEAHRAIGTAVPPLSDAQLAEVVVYETEAACYSLQLLHDLGITDLDQWVSDFAACDSAYLVHFYKTGEKLAFRAFWKSGAPLLDGRPIPEFHPTRWVTRNGTVV